MAVVSSWVDDSGVGVLVGTGVGAGPRVDVAVAAIVGSEVGVLVGTGVGVGSSVGVAVAADAGSEVGVLVGTGVDSGEGDGEDVEDLVGSGVLLRVSAAVGVGVSSQPNSTVTNRRLTKPTPTMPRVRFLTTHPPVTLLITSVLQDAGNRIDIDQVQEFHLATGLYTDGERRSTWLTCQAHLAWR